MSAPIRTLMLLLLGFLVGCGNPGTGGYAPNKKVEPTVQTSEVKDSSNIYAIDCLDYVQSPKELQLYCADGGQQISKIQWTSWDENGALGRATSTKNTCDPDCAASNYDIRMVSIFLSDPIKNKENKIVFSSITLKYDDPLSNGQMVETVELPTEPTL